MDWDPIYAYPLIVGTLTVVVLIIRKVPRQDPPDSIPFDSILDGEDSTMNGITTLMPDEAKHGT